MANSPRVARFTYLIREQMWKPSGVLATRACLRFDLGNVAWYLHHICVSDLWSRWPGGCFSL